MGEKKWYLLVFVFGVISTLLCQRFIAGETGGSGEYNSAVHNAKRQYDEHHNSASESIARSRNYNSQLEVGQRELGKGLREASRAIDEAIKLRTQEIERKQIKG